MERGGGDLQPAALLLSLPFSFVFDVAVVAVAPLTHARYIAHADAQTHASDLRSAEGE